MPKSLYFPRKLSNQFAGMENSVTKNELTRALEQLNKNPSDPNLAREADGLLNRLYSQLSQTGSEGLAFIPAILGFLQYDKLNSIVLANLIKLQAKGGKDYNERLVDSLEDLIELSPRQQVLKVLTRLFTIAPAICHQLFMENQTLVSYITRETTDLINDTIPKSRFASLLDLFSAACVDELCRVPIADQYSVVPIRALESADLHVRALGALVILKIWNNLKKETFKDRPSLSLSNLEKVLSEALEQNDSSAVEGLAYLSLHSKSMRDNHFLLEKLTEYLDSEPYGVVCVLANLTWVAKKDQLSQLKNINKEPDNEKQLRLFFKYLLDSGTVGKVTGLKSVSSRVQEKAIELLYNISTDRSCRPQLAQQGGVGTVVTYLVKSSQNIDYKNGISISEPVENQELRLTAINTLANILSSSNPTAVFTRSELVTPVPFLLEPLIQYDIEINGTNTASPLSRLEIDNAELFTSLVALINLSSVDDIDVKLVPVKLGWPAIGNLMLSANVQIRRCILELLANLIVTPLCMEKFFNWSSEKDDNHRNFKILVQLVDLDDRASQLAVLNILANSSDFELVAVVLQKSEMFLDRLFGLLQNQYDTDILLRGFYILQNLAHLPDHELVASYAQKHNLKGILGGLFRNVGDLEVRHMAIDACKRLQQ
ncbi:hypothetical protein KL949_001050 [Ogataea haglerorum]|nr:hypothetical protein KL913_001054 [Ogataea haglerorum]KAG7722072.1 hypothetical protein KL949_001050 [Ogataea haglerorum]KAG7770401.1 hypothetical protein KL931_002165 [Ogataea haglerorum]